MLNNLIFTRDAPSGHGSRVLALLLLHLEYFSGKLLLLAQLHGQEFKDEAETLEREIYYLEPTLIAFSHGLVDMSYTIDDTTQTVYARFSRFWSTYGHRFPVNTKIKFNGYVYVPHLTKHSVGGEPLQRLIKRL